MSGEASKRYDSLVSLLINIIDETYLFLSSSSQQILSDPKCGSPPS